MSAHVCPVFVSRAGRRRCFLGFDPLRTIDLLQHYLGHKNIQHTVRYTELSPDRFRDFWR